MIAKSEIGQLKSALESNPETKNIKMVFLMVNKRIKTKLIDGSRTTNPRPGCMLDHTITSHNEFDFFIVCTECRQGVPTPTHFSVLKNDIEDVQPEEIM